MPTGGVRITQNNRVITLVNTVRAEVLAHRKESIRDILFIPQVLFQLPAVGREGKLEIASVTNAFQFIQLVQQIARVLRPEHDTVHHFGRECQSADLFLFIGFCYI